MIKNYIYLMLLLCSLSAMGQHTFSIVAVDPSTGEIGSAGATCLDSIELNGEEGALVISDIILGKGAIHTQAAWDPVNQNAARDRMLNHNETPQQIINWLIANDPASGSINSRQYNIVAINGTSAGYTGSSASNQKGHRVGTNYAIAGNILISTDVLDDMETAFQNTSGPLCDKLMAAMQAAKRPGADARCGAPENVSSHSAFLRVAKPTDTNSSYGNLWLDLNISFTAYGVDPIDSLQTAFDAFKATLSTEELTTNPVGIYPNPSSGTLNILGTDTNKITRITLTNVLGQEVLSHKVSNLTTTLDLSVFKDGIYIIKCIDSTNVVKQTQKIVLKK